MASRREFMQAALASGLGCVARAAQLKSIGFQVYTVRSLMPQKAQETLTAIRAAGYREIEGTYAGFDAIWPAVESSGLQPVSMHLDSKMVTQGKPEDLVPVMDGLKKKGFRYAVMPYVPEPERGGPDVMKALAEKCNQAAEKARAAGLKFCYHNHAFEFAGEKGNTLFDVLLANTDKKLVGIELDLFWVSVAGNDPVEMLRKLAGRVPLVHLKDKARDTPVQYKESVPPATFQEVGSGVLDWPNILRAAAAAKVEHYFVEQDRTPGNPVDSLRQSFQFVSKLTY
ncbi:MAG: sugar phosphate isomerase/epimerase [Candidatus Solibacter sp.]